MIMQETIHKFDINVDILSRLKFNCCDRLNNLILISIIYQRFLRMSRMFINEILHSYSIDPNNLVLFASTSYWPFLNRSKIREHVINILG